MADAIDRTSRPIPQTIGLAFGGLWCVLGAQALGPPWASGAMALGGIVTVALVVRLWRAPPAMGGGTALFRRGAYFAAVAAEIAGITLASRVLPRSEFIPAVGAIVGLHFIGLWWASAYRRFLWIAGAMCVVSSMSAALPPGLREAVCGFGNALVLWAFASGLF